MMMSKHMLWMMLVLFSLAGCRTQHQIDMTHEVKPIHITLDVNLKVDRALDNFFGDIDQAAVGKQ
jgi:uncharacterized lipoprotein NlpE involved in copper resistance